jgi:hypothetical protein
VHRREETAVIDVVRPPLPLVGRLRGLAAVCALGLRLLRADRVPDQLRRRA